MLIQSGDPDHFRELIAPTGHADRIEQYGHRGFEVIANAAQFQDVGIFSATFEGARVLAEPERDFVGVTIPKLGRLEVFGANRPGTYRAESAHILGYGSPFDLRMEGRTDILVVNFFGPKLRTIAEAATDDRNAGRFDSDLRMDLRRPESRNFLSLLNFVFHDLQSKCGAKRSDVGQRELSSALQTAFVDAVTPGQFHEESNEPSWLLRAEEFIADHVDEPLCLANIANTVDVPVRTLTRAFAKYRGQSPIAFLNQLRLARVRTALQLADAREQTVTSVALKYGIGDLSRFPRRYARTYGELPSETLRAGRRARKGKPRHGH